MKWLFNKISEWHSAYLDWINGSFAASNKQLGIYRIVYGIFILFFVGVANFPFKMNAFPDGIYNPPPLFGSIFTSIPPIEFFTASWLIIYLGVFLVLIGLFTRVAGFITSILIIVNYGFLYSTGKIDHTFMVWFTMFAMSFSNWGEEYSIDSLWKKKSASSAKGWSISLIAMGLGFGFFTAGFIKLVSGWLSFKDSMLQAFFLRNFYVQGKQDYIASWLEHFNFRFFWESGDWFTIIFEIGFLLVLFRPVVFRFYTVLAIFFHGLVLLMMNIGFYYYLVVYFLFWTPLISNKVLSKMDQLFSSLTNKKWKIAAMVLVLLTLAILRFAFQWEYDLYIRHLVSDVLILFAFAGIVFMALFKVYQLFAKHNEAASSIVRFDGVCNLCNTSVQFVINRDKHNVFRFATLQGSKLDVDGNFNTIYLEKDGVLLEKSTAFLEIVRRLGGFWPYLYLFIVVPKPIRDFVYGIVARNRYKWFGKKDVCMMPTPELKHKFIETGK